MPFNTIYAVKFWNGRLDPYINKYGWPDMQLAGSHPSHFPEWFPDATGLNFRITRGPNPQPGITARNCVFVVPPGGHSLKSRIRVQLFFDWVFAEGFTSDGELRIPNGYPDPSVTDAVPWAIGVNISPKVDFLAESNVNVTCQFNKRTSDGEVRLNTPGALEGDQAGELIKWIHYNEFIAIEPPAFLRLENHFCGLTTDATKSIPGNGFLHIKGYGGWGDLEDSRVYTTDVFRTHNPSNPPIRALGATLVTMNGEGRLNARFREFRVAEAEVIP